MCFPAKRNSNGTFFAAIAPELSKKSSNSKRRVDEKELSVHMDNSMCHNGRKIQEYFARKKMTKTLHSVHSPDLSPCDFWFFGRAKE
jgi:hypothetical protein